MRCHSCEMWVDCSSPHNCHDGPIVGSNERVSEQAESFEIANASGQQTRGVNLATIRDAPFRPFDEQEKFVPTTPQLPAGGESRVTRVSTTGLNLISQMVLSGRADDKAAMSDARQIALNFAKEASHMADDEHGLSRPNYPALAIRENRALNHAMQIDDTTIEHVMDDEFFGTARDGGRFEYEDEEDRDFPLEEPIKLRTTKKKKRRRIEDAETKRAKNCAFLTTIGCSKRAYSKLGKPSDSYKMTDEAEAGI